MSRQELRAYHVGMAKRLRGHANASGLRDSDVEHYRKLAEFHDEMVATIDSLPEPLHRDNDGLDEYRHVGELDPAQRLALARGESDGEV